MKKFFLHMLLVSVLGMLTVSCRDEYEEAMAPESSKAQVVFSVAMDTPVSRTRATESDKTWGDKKEYESMVGDTYDNRIDINQLIVKIVDGNGDEYKITDIMKWKSGDNGYKFVGVVKDVTEAITLTDAKVYVYANMGTETPAETFEQDADYIPMWGVKKVSLSFAPGKRENAGEISLLRAMAKLEVKLANNEEMNEYKLTSATLNKYNKVGNTHPTLTDGFNGNTESLGLEGVLNVKNIDEAEAGTDLALTKTEDGSSYVVYLPEVVNGTSETDWLKISVTLKEKNGTGTEEGSFFIKDYSNEDNPVAIDIVRNHWYQYTIKGFAASEIQVSYNAVPWEEEFIEIGGDGFLFLNKDLIEIYNSNISEGELKFSSSSPIKSIVLTDLYTHNSNGTIVEGTADGVSAYYLSKYGQKVQLGTDPGFNITDKEAALAREQVILSNISATYQESALNGDITINSPFLADPTNEIPELQQNSHYDTPRYLEFLVTNQQELTATFRVMQYPPVVITNEEGYFSYRDDFTRKTGEEPAYWGNYMGPGSVTTLALTLYHEHDFTEEAKQPQSWWDTRQTDRDYSWLNKGSYPWLPENNAVPEVKGHEQWEEIRYMFIGDYVTFISHEAATKGKELTKGYSGGYRPYGPNGEAEGYATEAFVRSRYWNLPGATSSKMETQGVAIGPYYEREVVINAETGEKQTRTFRKHYTWNVQPVFYSKYVSNVYKADGKNASNRVRLKGQADIHNLMDGSYPDDIQTNFNIYSSPRLYRNHRMYHIKSMLSDKYVLGHPQLVDKNGNPTNDAEKGMTANTPSNANLVSPYFVVASQLGETDYNYIVTNAKNNGYNLPVLSDFFKLAENHCREYVEASYEDLNNNGKYDEGVDKLTHYHDWRLPTKAEIEMIINYQNKSRAMDQVLIGEHFICITGNPGMGDNEEYWVSSEVPGYKVSAEQDLDGIAYNNFGYYIRCVRDVKPQSKDRNGEVEE